MSSRGTEKHGHGHGLGDREAKIRSLQGVTEKQRGMGNKSRLTRGAASFTSGGGILEFCAHDHLCQEATGWRRPPNEILTKKDKNHRIRETGIQSRRGKGRPKTMGKGSGGEGGPGPGSSQARVERDEGPEGGS